MDIASIRRELTGSLRLLWTEELWLWSGAVTVLAGFFLWVGATGAALMYGADFAGIQLSVIEWSSVTTVVLGVVTVLWILAPAALVSYLVYGSLTNVSANLHTHYRVQHPSLLVFPFVALFAAGVGAGVGLGEISPALATALTVLGLLVLIRTVAYSYRVFSLSAPLLTYCFLFASLALVAITILVGAGIVAGRRTFVEAAAAGVDDLLGTSTVEAFVVGATAVGPLSVPTLLGATATLPVALALAYVLVQVVFGLVARLRKPDVPRSKLRTGQRYPAFARPISGTSSSNRGSSSQSNGARTGDTATSGDPADAGDVDATATAASGATTGAAGDGGTDAAGDDDSSTGADSGADDEAVSHTRVFTAPDDGEFDGGVPGVDEVPDAAAGTDAGSPDDSTETTVVDEADGYRCPTCAEQFESDTNFAYCPTCGTELELERSSK